MDGIAAGIIAGHSDASRASLARLQGQLRAACDGEDVTWADGQTDVIPSYRCLADTALAGPTALPPAVSASDRWVVAVNGRIYNHLEMRRKIGAQRPWRGVTNVETLAEAVDAWGFDLALTRAAGMFAIAARDCSERSLWLARDRPGEKSVYYRWLGNDFVSASKLRPICAFDGGRHLSVSLESLSLVASLNYIPAPRSIFRQVSKLASGCRVQLQAGGRDARSEQYWTYPPPRPDLSDPALPLDVQIIEVDASLRAAVRRQMPLELSTGALLSGGVDSSLVVALLQAESGERVKTFAIGFEDAAADESPYARKITQHLGTDHHELTMTSEMALGQIPRVLALLDEPMGDYSSQNSTMRVLGFAREHVSVIGARCCDAAASLVGSCWLRPCKRHATICHASRIRTPKRISTLPCWSSGRVPTSCATCPGPTSGKFTLRSPRLVCRIRAVHDGDRCAHLSPRRRHGQG